MQSKLETALARLTQEQLEAYEERAAIKEYDGGYKRELAEVSAYKEVVGNN